MTDNRSDRERNSSAKGRAADDTKRMERPPLNAWSPANVLETPPNTGEFRYRWIAEHVNGLHTPRNVQMALREGYQRVNVTDLPEDFLVDEDAKGDGYARTGGLILMRLPETVARQRQAYYAEKSLSAVNGANELQGMARENAVAEDRGTRTLDGADGARALANMSQA
jgi:hypothetical protein